MCSWVRFRCVWWGEVQVCGGVRLRCVRWGEVQVCVVG